MRRLFFAGLAAVAIAGCAAVPDSSRTNRTSIFGISQSELCDEVGKDWKMETLSQKDLWVDLLANEMTGYQGDIHDGKPHGRGVATFTDGSRFVGEWFNGVPQGHGVLTGSDRFRMEGEWFNGEIYRADITMPEVGKMSYQLLGNYQHGRFIVSTTDGKRIECEIRDRKVFDKREAARKAERAEREAARKMICKTTETGGLSCSPKGN